MAAGEATRHSSTEVTALFKKHGHLVNSDDDTIEWRLFCSVLKHLEPTYYTDGVLDALFQKVQPSAEKVEPDATFKLKSLIDSLFPQSSLASSVGRTPVLRVRKLTGDEVLSLTLEEVNELSTVQRLRAEAGKAISRSTEEVSLILGVQQLDDAETLEPLLVEGTVLEVLMAIQQSPEPDDATPASLASCQALKSRLLSPQRGAQQEAARTYRKLLSLEDAPPIDVVIENGVVPRLLELCGAEDSPELQSEAAWALTNVASGTAEQTRAVVDAGAVPVFVRLLESQTMEVCAQAAWALGNISGESGQLRDLVLQSGALQPTLHLLRAPSVLTLAQRRTAVWMLSNLCRGQPQPDLAQLLPALETLSRNLLDADPEIVTDTAYSLAYMSDGSSERISAVLGAGVLPRVVELLAHPSPAVQTPMLRIVGHLVLGDNSQKQQVLSAGVLPHLRAMLGHRKIGIQSESCCAISRILAGSPTQIQEVLDAGLIPALLELSHRATHGARKEVAIAIGNATSGGSTEQIQRLVEVDGLLPHMLEALDINDDAARRCLMSGLENVLIAGDQLKEDRGMLFHPWAARVLEAGGLERLTHVADEGVPEVAQKARTLLTQFLGQEAVE